MNEHLKILGMRVEDRVTGAKGVVTSVCFDLYGCIQAIINPGLDADGKSRESQWYDIARLRIVNEVPVMPQPDFVSGLVAQGLKGPAEKPRMNKA